MQERFLVLLATLAVFVFSPSIQAQTAPQSGAGKAIPDLSGIWEGPLNSPGEPVTLCGEPACRAVRGLPPPRDLSKNLEEPQMLPWAEERYKALRAAGANANGNPLQQLNPSWSGCMPEGPTESTRRRAVELRQFPDIVFLFYDQDHAVRRVYMDGRGHPQGQPLTWMGHSTGKYDGDTLVVDTVGINDKVWVDLQGHLHTDALHVVERFRRTSQSALEIEITIDDPKTYEKPWRKQVVRELQEPGVPRIWDESECEELLRMDTHYSAESKK